MNRQHGFTLVELIITLVIAAILTTVAVPSFNTTIKNNRLITQTNALVASLNLARSEAIKHARQATVCVSSNQNSCTGGTDWSQGWLVWVDVDNDNVLDNGEERRVVETLPPNMTFTANVSQIQYTAQGAVTGTGTFSVCDDRSGETGRTIRIRNTGRANLQDLACS